MSPEGAAQPLQLGAPEDHPAEPLSLSLESLFLNLLRSGEITEGSYPSATEGAEESGLAKEPTRPAGPSGVRLPPTLTGHIPHTPGPYGMMFRSPGDPVPGPPSPVSIPGQGLAPGTPTADPPSRHAPVPAGR